MASAWVRSLAAELQEPTTKLLRAFVLAGIWLQRVIEEKDVEQAKEELRTGILTTMKTQLELAAPHLDLEAFGMAVRAELEVRMSLENASNVADILAKEIAALTSVKEGKASGTSTSRSSVAPEPER